MHPLEGIHFEVLQGNSTANASLHLKNNAPSRVAFKIKTTAPEAYLVRPTVGVLESQASLEVIITMKTSHLANVQKHKFSIQSKLSDLEPSDIAGVTAMWSTAGKLGVQQVVLRVTTAEVEPKTPVSAQLEPEPFSPIKDPPKDKDKSALTDLIKQNVQSTQQALATQKNELEKQLKVKREEISAVVKSQSVNTITGAQLVLIAILGLVLGLALFR